MKNSTLVVMLMVCIGIMTLTSAATTQAVGQESLEKYGEDEGLWSGIGARSLEGAWDVTVTIRNCADGTEVRSLPRLITFFQGGTVQETAAGGTQAAPAPRTPGHGIWESLGGRSFRYTIKFLRLDANGGPAGYLRETRSVDVDETGNNFAATGVATIFLPNGVQIGPICATETGAKIGF